MKSCNIAKQELRVRVDFDFLTALRENQFVGAPGLMVPTIKQALVALLKLGGMNWTARPLQIGRGSHSNVPCIEAFSGYKC